MDWKDRMDWKDGAPEDPNKLETKGRWMVSRDRESWRKILREIKALTGMCTEEDDDCFKSISSRLDRVLNLGLQL